MKRSVDWLFGDHENPFFWNSYQRKPTQWESSAVLHHFQAPQSHWGQVRLQWDAAITASNANRGKVGLTRHRCIIIIIVSLITFLVSIKASSFKSQMVVLNGSSRMNDNDSNKDWEVVLNHLGSLCSGTFKETCAWDTIWCEAARRGSKPIELVLYLIRGVAFNWWVKKVKPVFMHISREKK